MPVAPTIYQLKLWLRNIEPTNWRRVEVPFDMALLKLHLVIQVVMGWKGCHLHEFQVAGRRYEIPDPENFEQNIQTLDECRVKLSTIVPNAIGNEFNYLYDFGDCWEHDLLLEAILPESTGVQYPRCTDGARNGIPEDVGGVGGYEDYV